MTIQPQDVWFADFPYEDDLANIADGFGQRNRLVALCLPAIFGNLFGNSFLKKFFALHDNSIKKSRWKFFHRDKFFYG